MQDEINLNLAYEWLIKRRKNAPPNADIWHLRFNWPIIKTELLNQLQSGTYLLKPMLVVGKQGITQWSAADALALKWVELSIYTILPKHKQCEHIKGHGGGVQSAHRIGNMAKQRHFHYVCRTDIKGYYGNINKTILIEQLRQYIDRPAYLNLLTQYINYTVEDGGEFYTPAKGICRGCSLSPLMAAFHLYVVDCHFAQLMKDKKLHYIRYMDDFIILTKTRWQLRHAVKLLNQFFNAFGFKQHPDKTFIGRISKGFDWMGAWITDCGVIRIAPRAIQNHLDRLLQLYEHVRKQPAKVQAMRVEQYRLRWQRWAKSVICYSAMAGSYDASHLQTGSSRANHAARRRSDALVAAMQRQTHYYRQLRQPRCPSSRGNTSLMA